MAAILPLFLAIAGCAAPREVPSAAQAALRVTNGDRPFGPDEGGPARKQAEAICAGRGKALRTSIHDRFDAGAWVYPEGCA